MRLVAILALIGLMGCGVQPGTALPPVSTAPSGGTLAMAAGGVVETQSGLRIDFGRTRDSTLPAVSRLLGAPPASVQIRGDCGAGPTEVAQWPNAGIELLFTDGDFRGWVATSNAVPNATGVAVGMDRAEVNARGAGIRPSAAGEAFSIGGLNGQLSEKGVVTAIWSGTTCFSR